MIIFNSMSVFAIKEPPDNWKGRLKFLGPGFILSASIVGSGELIATTILGAKGGFITFWVILVSCLVKVAIQLEFGKNAILTGQTPMEGFARLGGPKIGSGNWAVGSAFVLTLIKILQVGGMLGGSAIALNLLIPQIPIAGWALALGLFTSSMIYRNKYAWIEKGSLVMVVGFTLFTLIAVFSLNQTAFSFGWKEVWSGLQFQLPSSLVFVAIGAFGITGVASDEIIAYNYWCLEKGYAAYTGKNDGSEEWKRRAKGWIQVMHLDAMVAMVIYTLVTAAFYLLGASVLHGQQDIPEGNAVIDTLANIYTQTLGSGVRNAYLIGAFFVLYSSVFATLAYWSRLFMDIFSAFHWIDGQNKKIRSKGVALLAWIIPFLWILAYLYMQLPTFMVMLGGVVGSILLLVVVAAGIVFRNQNRKFKIQTGRFSETLFWLSVISIGWVGLYGILKLS
jgi:Mn2+/Fe2+ NRAMP family transporter